MSTTTKQKARRAKLRAVEAIGAKQCVYCGATRRLQFAHLSPTKLKGRGRGRFDRYYDVIKNPTKYALMCPGCHYEHDNSQEREKEPWD